MNPVLPPPSPPSTPPGWYPDPHRPGGWRWWDGATWTGHASAPALPGPPPATFVESERTLAGPLRTLIVLEAVVFILQLVAVGAQFRIVAEIIRDDDGLERELPGWLTGVQFVGVLALGVLIVRVLWMARAAEAGRRLGRPARHSPGVAAAGWVIPIVNFWFPYQDIRALLAGDDANRARVGWWWGLRLVGQIGVVGVAVAGFGPFALQALVVAACALAYAASVLIERDLIAAILRGHEAAAGMPLTADP